MASYRSRQAPARAKPNPRTDPRKIDSVKKVTEVVQATKMPFGVFAVLVYEGIQQQAKLAEEPGTILAGIFWVLATSESENLTIFRHEASLKMNYMRILVYRTLGFLAMKIPTTAMPMASTATSRALP